MHLHSPLAPDEVPAPETAEDALMGCMLALGRRMRQRQPEDEVDFSAIPILRQLAFHGPMRLSALAGLLQLDASTVSRHARQLEDRGLLERSEDPDDGRASRVGVSGEGTACLAKGFAARRSMITQALDGWTEQERETLRSLLYRFHQDLVTTPLHEQHPHPQENS